MFSSVLLSSILAGGAEKHSFSSTIFCLDKIHFDRRLPLAWKQGCLQVIIGQNPWMELWKRSPLVSLTVPRHFAEWLTFLRRRGLAQARAAGGAFCRSALRALCGIVKSRTPYPLFLPLGLPGFQPTFIRGIYSFWGEDIWYEHQASQDMVHFSKGYVKGLCTLAPLDPPFISCREGFERLSFWEASMSTSIEDTCRKVRGKPQAELGHPLFNQKKKQLRHSPVTHTQLNRHPFVQVLVRACLGA